MVPLVNGAPPTIMSRSLVLHPSCVASRILCQSSVHGSSINVIQSEPLPPREQFGEPILNGVPIAGREVLCQLVQEFLHVNGRLNPSLQKCNGSSAVLR